MGVGDKDFWEGMNRAIKEGGPVYFRVLWWQQRTIP